VIIYFGLTVVAPEGHGVVHSVHPGGLLGAGCPNLLNSQPFLPPLRRLRVTLLPGFLVIVKFVTFFVLFVPPLVAAVVVSEEEAAVVVSPPATVESPATVVATVGATVVTGATVVGTQSGDAALAGSAQSVHPAGVSGAVHACPSVPGK